MGVRKRNGRLLSWEACVCAADSSVDRERRASLCSVFSGSQTLHGGDTLLSQTESHVDGRNTHDWAQDPRERGEGHQGRGKVMSLVSEGIRGICGTTHAFSPQQTFTTGLPRA